MKVLHFYKTYFPHTVGGVEKVIEQIVIGTSQMGIESEVLSLSPNKKSSSVERDGYKVHDVPQLFEIASTPFSIQVFKKFSQLVEKADIIHYHFPWPFADLVHFATKIALRYHKPALVTYHSDIIKQKILSKLCKPLMNHFLSDMKSIVVTSPNYFYTSKILPKFSNKVSVIPIGIEETSYPKPSEEKLEYWRRRFGCKFFLFVGVMRYYKGLHFLIEASKGVKAPILIVGSGDPIERELKIKATHLGATNVHFLGAVSEEDKVALQMLCYAVVLPSHLRSEAFGISLLEGAMFSKPMISCEIGTGTTYININKETGLAVSPADPMSLRQALEFLLEKPDIAQAMGMQARIRYLDYFTGEKMAKSYAEIYHSLGSVRLHSSS